MHHVMPADASASIADDPAPDRPGNCACRAGTAAPEATSWETRVLIEHAELAMRLGRLVVRQAEQADWLGANGDVMFVRISHAMQVSVALKAKLEAEAERRARRDAAEQARRAAEALQARERRKAMVRQVIETAIGTQADIDADPARAARLRLDLEVRLGELDIAGELEGRSFGAIVAGVRRELGITPDRPVAPVAAFEQAAECCAALHRTSLQEDARQGEAQWCNAQRHCILRAAHVAARAPPAHAGA